jgi:hypothetical protein
MQFIDMDFKIFGKEGSTTLMLIPGLGVSYEIFLPLIDILKASREMTSITGMEPRKHSWRSHK